MIRGRDRLGRTAHFKINPGTPQHENETKTYVATEFVERKEEAEDELLLINVELGTPTTEAVDNLRA